jgi:hypothetical protein
VAARTFLFPAKEFLAMKAWMLSVLELVGVKRPRSRPTATRPSQARPRDRAAFEHLERREVLSAPGIVPFASIPASVTTAGQPAHVALHFAPGQITSDRSGTVVVGFYARPTGGSALNPRIAEVDGPMGRQFPVSIPKRGTAAPSKALFLTTLNTNPGKPQDIAVDVLGLDDKVGSFVLEAFLPGDVNGDGSVDPTDLARLQPIYKSTTGQANFDPAADFNADGHVGCIDRRLTEMNQGARVSYNATPVPTVPRVPTVTPTAVPKAPATPPVPMVPTVAPAPAPAPTPAPVMAKPAAPPVTVVAATPVQAITPLATLPTTVVTPAVVATVPATAVVAPASPTPVLVAPVPAGSVVSSGLAPTSGTTPVYAVSAPPTSAGALVTTAPAAVGYVPAPTSSSPVYYYGQPTIQGPAAGYVAAPAPSSSPVYYYGQPTIQGPSSGYVAVSGPGQGYYYSQPAGQVAVPVR